MENKVIGELKVLFELPSEHMQRDLALLDAGFKVSEEVTDKIEIVIVNNKGERTVVRTLDWNSELIDVVDSDGISVV